MSLHGKFNVRKAYLDRIVVGPKHVWRALWCIIEPPLVVFYVYGISSRIGSLQRIDFGGRLSVMVVVCFVSMGLKIRTSLQ